MLKFFYNGIKASGGKLQKAHFSFGNYTTQSGINPASVTIYARDYDGFSAEVAAAFPVENNTDTQTDYFEKDRIRVSPEHPLYAAVVAAYDAQQVKRGQPAGLEARSAILEHNARLAELSQAAAAARANGAFHTARALQVGFDEAGSMVIN